MAWNLITDSRGGRWAINMDGVLLLARLAARTRMIRRRTRLVTTDNGFWLPATYGMEIDWRGYRAAAEVETLRYWQEAEMQLRTDPHAMQGTLLGLISDTRADMTWLQRQKASANARTQESIGSTVSTYENLILLTQVVRDSSAAILIVGAGVLSGGVATAVASGAMTSAAVGGTVLGVAGVSSSTVAGALVVGSVARGVATYTDTGSVGSAAINSVTTLAVASIGIAGAGASVGRTAVMMVISSGVQGGGSGLQALVEGKSSERILMSSAVGASSTALGGLVGAAAGGMVFSAQVGLGGGIDTAGNMFSNYITSDHDQTALPQSRGTADFGGIPQNSAEDVCFVFRTCLRRLP